VRRSYIAKADEPQKLRPLGVLVLEDKIVQRAATEVLSAFYEQDFVGFSYGFRPGRSPHQALDALAKGMGEAWRKTVVLAVTEFGRTAAVNGTRGTDHGTATMALLLGGAVQGGRVLADWPGLAQSALYQGRDLKPTLDLRALEKAVLADHLGLSPAQLAQTVFPGSESIAPVRGLIRA
jgi:hypothetical protein